MNTAPRDPYLHVLQHALGIDEYGRGESYRNSYVASEGHHSWALLIDLEAAGFMVRCGPHDLFGGGYRFMVTEAGRAYVREHSPKPPKRARRRAS